MFSVVEATVFPSPSFFSDPGSPIKVEIFFSFPPLPVGLRIHGEVSHNETWEHWQPAVGRGQVGTGRITREGVLSLRSAVPQHVFTAGLKDYCCPSTASVFLNDSLSSDSLCVSLTWCGIKMDYTFSLPDWIRGYTTSDSTNTSQRATQTTGCMLFLLHIPWV